MKKLAIFDLDGTLLNTIEDLGYAANHALQAHGYPTHSIASYPFFVGNGERRLIERVLPEDARTEATIDRLLITFKEYYNDHNTDYTKPYEGIPELLSLLSSRGVAIAVASNKYQAATEKLISHFFPTLSFIAVEGQKEGVPVKTLQSCLKFLQKPRLRKPTQSTSATLAWIWKLLAAPVSIR